MFIPKFQGFVLILVVKWKCLVVFYLKAVKIKLRIYLHVTNKHRYTNAVDNV